MTNDAKQDYGKETLDFDLKNSREILLALGTAVRSKRFALAAFLVPVFIRSIPEILVGPYPIGWDTIAFYVPNTLDWATGRQGWLASLGTAPLLYMISVPAYLFSRVNPVWIFKLMGPVLYGSMILALYRFLRLGLSWTERMSLGAVLMTSLYFVTLRISWDLYRNMLGLTFVLLSLPLFHDLKSRTSQLLLAGLIVLAVASDQLTGVVALSVIGARTLLDLARRNRTEFLRLVWIGVPGFLFSLGVAFAGVRLSGVTLLQQQAPVPGLDTVVASAGFLGYIYLPIAPLIFFGLRRTANLELKSWTVVVSCLTLSALVPFLGLIVASYRWSLLLDIPMCVYASAGLAGVVSAGRPSISSSGLLRGSVLPLASLVLVVSAGLYVVMPAQQAMLYYTTFPSYLPTSMIQDTVPISDMASLRLMLSWVQENTRAGTVLITHQAIYGWARAYLPPGESIVNYKYSDPLVGVQMARSAGYSSVLMIWWVNGSGWHGQAFVPSGFVPVATDGSIAVYTYY